MNFSKKSGKKKAAIATVVCFAAAIAIAGTYTFNDYKKSQSEKELAMAEEMNFTEEKYTVESKENMLDEPANAKNVSNESLVSDVTGAVGNAENILEDADMSIAEAPDNILKNVSASDTISVNFTSDSMILWPVSGEILMDYSMDKTVYFKTLEQYKYNPAILIAAAENDQVIAGVSGIVKSIDNTARTGMTVNIDLGNGYEAFYGQLLNVSVTTGEYVDATTTLGFVAAPTKYYSSEGSNVYFEMRKDGQPVDPKQYLTD